MHDSSSSQVVPEQHVEGLSQLGYDLAFIADAVTPEEGHVELAAQLVAGLQVGGVTVAGSNEGSLQVGFGTGELAHRCCQAFLGVGYLGAQPVLLALEQVERDGVGVVGVKELLALAFKLRQSSCLAGALTLPVATQLGQLLRQIRA